MSNELIFASPYAMDMALDDWVSQTHSQVVAIEDVRRLLVGFAAVTPERLITPAKSITVFARAHGTNLMPSALLFPPGMELPRSLFFMVSVRTLKQGSYRTVLCTTKLRQRLAFVFSYPRGTKSKDDEMLIRRDLRILS